MAVFNLLQRRVQLPLQLLRDPAAEDFRDLVGRHTPQTDLAGTFKDFVNWEMPFEDEVPAVLDLIDGVEPAQIHGGPLSFREVGTEPTSPVIQTLLDHAGSEAISRRL